MHESMSLNKLAQVLAKYRDHPDFLGLPIDNVNQRGSVDDAPLHIAARVGSISDVQELLDCGADVNLSGDLGNTPLHYAAMLGRVDIVDLLVKSGANIASLNEFGQNAVEVADVSNQREVVATLLRHR